ncbi:tetratricopeptide repeat protein [candidate division KSB1 bacterium]|nr:tetratricopeptide repeat protein [candidate division KSB1 bacterium]NIR72849.1 tetratricopeptide repeat protein [candidate division KSB1 bacterium]NIS23748.1 tetratricopeptide repeat protein [candidate division KSB1 bacterium]NIT70669.1 tetratricopeptide repeat protein [candidate division KSB1 bacterium]NIU24398.1 tetratricopeptide repeat protein [candidate division KSB1 bacterium]
MGLKQTFLFFLTLVFSTSLSAQTSDVDVKTFLQKADSLRTSGEFKEAEVAYKQALVFDKKCVKAFIGLGKIAYSNENWEEAQNWFREALSVEPDNAEAQAFFANPRLQALIHAADSLRTREEYDAAEERLKDALDIDKHSIPALLGLAKIFYEKREWGDVKKWCKKVLELEPENEDALHLLTTNPSAEAIADIDKGEEFFKQENYDDAEDRYKDALDHYEGSMQAFRGLGRIAYHREDWGNVKDWFDKIEDILPEDLEANYFLGIGNRETGKFKSLLMKKWDFNASNKHFARVYQADSTYRDVLYQRGLLEREKEHYLRAVKWGHRQIALKPELTHANVGLYKFYRLFLRHRSDREVKRWVNRKNDDWCKYVRAELYRLNENYEEAESALHKLLEQTTTSINENQIYLRMVRLYVQQGREEEASEYFKLALNSIDTDLDAEYVFEDSKYIFTDEELKEFHELIEPEDKRVFFQKFWRLRNPLPASSVNPRAMEHYRRLVFAEKNYWYDGLRSWASNPDKVGYLKFPDSYYENKEFNDKGMVYLRHGPPDEVAVTAGRITSNESWHYLKRPDRPEFIFHFLKEARLSVGNNWQLAPFLPDLNMVQDRVGWDSKLDRLLLASSQQEITSVQNQIADESYLVVKEAMETDTHTWAKGTEELWMPYYVASFRGENNNTHLEVYYGLNLQELMPGNGLNLSNMFFEHGVGIYDQDWNEIDLDNGEVALASPDLNRSFGNIYIHRYERDLKPGTYHLTLASRKEGTRKVGGDNIEIEVPRFEKNRFELSDLELAYNIQPASGNSIFKKGDLEIVPNPSKVFKLPDQVYLYFEIYDLQKDKDGETAFEIEHTMKQAKDGGGLFGFLGGGAKKVISIKDKRTGHESTFSEFTSFDVGKLDEGDYELQVKVKDLNSGDSAEKSIALTLKKD